jgi:hypothetical protein
MSMEENDINGIYGTGGIIHVVVSSVETPNA